MHFLYMIFWVLVIIIVLLLIVALFVKKDFLIEKEIMIKKTKQDVFNYLKLIRNQEKYSVWVMKDPNIQIKYTGTDGTVGFTSSWTSDDKNVGIGAQEIIEIVEGEHLKVEIRFKKPFEGTNHATTLVSSQPEGYTKVLSRFTGNSKYPMNIMNLFMNSLIGKDMQQNLDNMKRNLEND